MSKSNSINAQIFYALKISENSKVPFLFMSAPGMGKSTSVKWFAELEGYELETLRGNSTSEDEIMGYDVVDTTPGARSALHLIPDWFKRVQKNQQAGKKTLLFIDEITTCSEQVQSALLHLIFERKVHSDDLPEDTLVVAAGNYSQSLGNSFGLIPPLMNRFCIFNIIPDNDDIIPFLSHYEGKKDYMKEMKGILEKMEKNKKAVSPEVMNRIGEYIEMGVRETTKLLQSSTENKIDIKVTDTQNIYGDVVGDQALMGFVTPRTLCYFRDASISAYICYGKDGIINSNYKKIIEGLVGLGLTRTKDTINKNVLTDIYYTHMSNVVSDLEKLENNKIVEYENYFKVSVENKTPGKITIQDIISINNKLTELKNDQNIKSIDRPIELKVIKKLCDVFLKKSNASEFNIDSTDALLNGGTGVTTIEEFSKNVANWNSVVDTFENLGTLVSDASRNYNDDAKKVIEQTRISIGRNFVKLKVLRKNLTKVNAVEADLIPEFHNQYLGV